MCCLLLLGAKVVVYTCDECLIGGGLFLTGSGDEKRVVVVKNMY